MTGHTGTAGMGAGTGLQEASATTERPGPEAVATPGPGVAPVNQATRAYGGTVTLLFPPAAPR
jgi:hypothetical protein